VSPVHNDTTSRDEFDHANTSAPADPWSVHAPDVEQRMLDLVYRVARQVGCSRRTCEQLCLRVVGPRFWVCDRASTELAEPTKSAGLAHALLAAVALDEVTLLPPRQRFAVCAAGRLDPRPGRATAQRGLGTVAVWTNPASRLR
jgi:hypothetical protein